MMKKLLLLLGGGLIALSSITVWAAIDPLGTKGAIWNQDSEKALTSLEGDNPIREGMYWTVHNPKDNDYYVDGVISEKIETHSGAVDATMNLIQIIIDYALGILAFIALIYLIYHGFLMLTASGDEKQFDKGKGGIKIAVIALIGIGMSRLIVSLILWLITKLTS